MAVARQLHEDGHAIVAASFAVEFASQPVAPTIRELVALHSKVAAAYPRRREMRGHTVGISASQIEIGDPPPQLGEPVPLGFTFDSLRPNGEVERAIMLNGKVLSITRADYEGWQETWGEVRSIFAMMLPILLQRANATTFHLQYHDRFVWEGELDAFRSDMIFRRGSHYLAPNAFEVPDLWHSNHGFFEYPEAPTKHQLLSTADVQVVLPERVGADPSWGLVADVKLNHRALHGVERAGGRAKAVETPEEVLGDAGGGGLLDHYMEEMHAKCKWLLARLINDEMCDKIKLPRPE